MTLRNAMKNIRVLWVCIILLAFCMSASEVNAVAAPDDGNNYNGYWWSDGWVPGLATFETQFLRIPQTTIGSAVFYAPGMMEANIEYRGLLCPECVGGVAVPFCSEIGHKVWLLRPGSDINEWDGPFIVADCSRRNDLYGHIVYRDQVVEVDFETAVEWGMARYGGTEHEGRWSTLTGRLDGIVMSTVEPSQYDGNITDLTVWFLKHVEYARPSENRRQIENYIPPQSYIEEIGVENPNDFPLWLINDKWILFP